MFRNRDSEFSCEKIILKGKRMNNAQVFSHSELNQQYLTQRLKYTDKKSNQISKQESEQNICIQNCHAFSKKMEYFKRPECRKKYIFLSNYNQVNGRIIRNIREIETFISFLNLIDKRKAMSDSLTSY